MSGTESKPAPSPPAGQDSPQPAKEAVESAVAATDESSAPAAPTDSRSQPVAAPLPAAHWAEVAQVRHQSNEAIGDELTVLASRMMRSLTVTRLLATMWPARLRPSPPASLAIGRSMVGRSTVKEGMPSTGMIGASLLLHGTRRK